METHRKECSLEIIQCEYHKVGCEIKMARKDQEKHKKEQMENHLMMSTSELSNTKAQLATAFEQIRNLTVLMYSQLNPTAEVSTACTISAAKWSITLNAMASIFKAGNQVLPATLQVSGYSKMKENDEQWYSYPFYTHTQGYKMCLNIVTAGNGDGKGTYLSAFLYLMKGSHDNKLKWPLRGTFGIKLLNQISNNEHHLKGLRYDDMTRNGSDNRVIMDNRAKTAWGHPQFFSNKNLHMITPTCQYLKDDCLVFQVMKL